MTKYLAYMHTTLSPDRDYSSDYASPWAPGDRVRLIKSIHAVCTIGLRESKLLAERLMANRLKHQGSLVEGILVTVSAEQIVRLAHIEDEHYQHPLWAFRYVCPVESTGVDLAAHERAPKEDA